MSRFAWVVLTIVSAAMLCSAQSVVYVSNATGTQVLAINTATGTANTIYASNGAVPEDGTYGPDGLLYFCDPSRGLILQIDPSTKATRTVYAATAGGSPAAPQGPRFTPTGDLVFNDKGSGGLWIIDSVAGQTSFSAPRSLFAPAAGAGGGIAFTNKGDLLFVSGNAVWRSRRPYTSGSIVFDGLTGPAGLARDNYDKIYVANGNGVLQRCVLPAVEGQKGTCSASYTFSSGGVPQVPYFVEVTADQQVWVATADAAFANGRVWRIDLTQSSPQPQLIAVLPKVKGKYPPAVGMAIPPTASRVVTKPVATGTPEAFQFGPNAFELTVQTCSSASPLIASIRSSQRLPSQVNAMMAGATFNGSQVNPTAVNESGQEGFSRVFTVDPVHCTDADIFRTAISNYADGPRGINPGIVRCDAVGMNYDCTVLPLFGYWIESGLLPEDAISSGNSRGFSDFILADIPFAIADVRFGGILSPFDSRSEDPNFPTTFNTGQNITFKFRALDANNNPVPNVVAVISVERLGATSIRIPVDPSGSSNEPPTFRHDNGTGQYLYNLSTADSTIWKPGRYAANIMGVNAFHPRTVYFCLETCNAAP